MERVDGRLYRGLYVGVALSVPLWAGLVLVLVFARSVAGSWMRGLVIVARAAGEIEFDPRFLVASLAVSLVLLARARRRDARGAV